MSMQRKNVIYFVKTSPFDMPQGVVCLTMHTTGLKPTQPEAIKARAYSNILASLPHYDITQLYALDSDMTKYHVHQAHTILPVTCINEEKISRLLTHADYIF